MTIAEIAVGLRGMGAVAFLSWFFFGPKQSHVAQINGDLQEILAHSPCWGLALFGS